MRIFLSAHFIRYCIVGVINTALYTGLLFSFLSFTALPSYWSVALAFVLSMLFQYVANRLFTFRSSNKLTKEVPRYLVAGCINYTLSALVVFWLVNVLLIPPFQVSIISSLLAATLGFILSSLWVFKGSND